MLRNKKEKSVERENRGKINPKISTSKLILSNGTSLSVEKEYEIVRTEILQYVEEYQTIRNMMYVFTASILGINSGVWNNCYIFLLPLIVILPSYLLFYDYWWDVVCASTYIRVFLDGDTDDENQRPDLFHWEARHARFREKLRIQQRKSKGKLITRITLGNMLSQKISYITCDMLCIILFFINARTKETIFHFIFTWPFYLKDLILGAVITVFSGAVFFIFWNINDSEFMRAWIAIKNDKPSVEVRP